MERTKRWLRTKIIGITSVQSCYLTSGNSLTVNTWTGVVINIFLLEEPVKTRAIRQVLQEGTQVGLGAMFILAANLIPPPETRFEAPEWMLALHAVHRECLYSYTLGGAEEESRIIPVHLEQIANSGNYVAKYGPPITFETLRYTKAAVGPRYIKGDWLVADFGYHALWRDSHRPRQTSYRRPAANDYQWRAWSQTTWEQNVSQEIPVPQRPVNNLMTKYYQMLELAPEASAHEVKTAFRKLALAVHPDTSNLPKDEAAAKFRELTEAYEFIKRQKNW
jgi:hypothetical protein